MIKILNGGMLSTIQDEGRFGVMKNGFTQSGVMDLFAMRLANALCKNSLNAPVIEMTMLGITAEFNDDTIFCLSGGSFRASLGGTAIDNNRTYAAKKGDVLTVGPAQTGMRCYLAVAGGFKVPLVMGSASTNLKIGIGGFEGRKLKAGDIIETGTPSPKARADIHDYDGRQYNNIVTVRVVLGPQDAAFTETDLEFFLKQQYTVTPSLDRMGIRLSGIALRGKDGLDIISDGIPFGSVQITRSGQPIILMADHQTTGGYAKIATVISADLPALAQLKPFDYVFFKAVSVQKAEKLKKSQQKYFKDILKR